MPDDEVGQREPDHTLEPIEELKLMLNAFCRIHAAERQSTCAVLVSTRRHAYAVGCPLRSGAEVHRRRARLWANLFRKGQRVALTRLRRKVTRATHPSVPIPRIALT